MRLGPGTQCDAGSQPLSGVLASIQKDQHRAGLGDDFAGQSAHVKLSVFEYLERGIVNDQEKNQAIITELTKAYWMELETVINYLANSINLDGVRAEEIKKIVGGGRDRRNASRHATRQSDQND